MKIYFSFLCKLDISISHLCSAKKAMYLVYETTILQAAVTEKELNSLTTYPWDEWYTLHNYVQCQMMFLDLL